MTEDERLMAEIKAVKAKHAAEKVEAAAEKVAAAKRAAALAVTLKLKKELATLNGQATPVVVAPTETQLLQQQLNKLNAQKAANPAPVAHAAPASTAYSSPAYSTPSPAPVT